MITIPTWLFILLIVFASFTAVSFLLIIIYLIIFAITEHVQENKIIRDMVKYGACPYEVDSDPDYNPEYIPKEDRQNG